MKMSRLFRPLLFGAMIFSVVSCKDSSKVAAPPVTASVNWRAFVLPSAASDVGYLGLEGPLFSTSKGQPPTPGVRTASKTIDGIRFEGLVVEDEADATILEIYARREENGVSVYAKSTIAFVLRIVDYPKERVLVTISGQEQETPVTLAKGEYRISIPPPQ